MTSTNWQRVVQHYEGLPMLLRTASPAFVASEEAAALAPEDWALPGVVLAAWGRFLSRSFSEERLGQLSVAERAVVKSQFDLLEDLCNSEDLEVVNAVAVEIFEHLHEHEGWHRDFTGRLGPRARWEYGLATKRDPR